MSSSSKNENTEARETEISKTLAEKQETSEECEEFEGAPQTDSEEKETCEQKLTEKGKQYQKDILDSKVKASSTKLRQEIEKIKKLISSSAQAEHRGKHYTAKEILSTKLKKNSMKLVTLCITCSKAKMKEMPRIVTSIYATESA